MTDNSRLYQRIAAGSVPHYLVCRIFQFRRGQHAHCNVFRPTFHPDCAHLLVLSRLCPHIPLAVDDPDFPLPPISRQETQRLAQSYRLLRLRSGPASSWHNCFLSVTISVTYGGGVLPQFRHRANGHHFTKGRFRYTSFLPQPFPSLCPDAPYQGPSAVTR